MVHPVTLEHEQFSAHTQHSTAQYSMSTSDIPLTSDTHMHSLSISLAELLV